MITSTSNPKIKSIRSLQSSSRSRREEGLFVVEGVRLVEEALSASWQAQLVIHTDDQSMRGQAVIQGFAAQGTPIEAVTPHVMKAASDTQTPQGLLAVFAVQKLALPKTLDFILVPAGVRDPGNLGTILRSAEAAGADLVVLTPGSVDPYNPKVVRGSAGAVFHVPVITATIDDVLAAGFATLGTTSHDALGRTVVPYTDADLTGRIAVVMGNEAAGLPTDWTDVEGPIGSWVTIPHRGRSESLNVAMAATVLVFEAARQRVGRRDQSSTSNAAG